MKLSANAETGNGDKSPKKGFSKRKLGLLCCAVLCCAVLCCAVLCCAVHSFAIYHNFVKHF
ncbi:hypothetical protein [Moraxella bovis]|uniref:hypothetical protein n=1 Tax=Moraxella bovis TaxID=476 RepID=UPI002226169B|nr:hypothetical protein [Moraxella bovis]UYZ79795.1 hypothetical protein LP115_14125 [Moraxella bovis]UYZ99218.1 hypothetical protein LP107_14190 [Moraxella bovis]UZA55789.1 hypothetical protein LP111_14460 [Moraxella bovis]